VVVNQKAPIHWLDGVKILTISIPGVLHSLVSMRANAAASSDKSRCDENETRAVVIWRSEPGALSRGKWLFKTLQLPPPNLAGRDQSGFTEREGKRSRPFCGRGPFTRPDIICQTFLQSQA
jgi:hypothetical protein